MEVLTVKDLFEHLRRYGVVVVNVTTVKVEQGDLVRTRSLCWTQDQVEMLEEALRKGHRKIDISFNPTNAEEVLFVCW